MCISTVNAFAVEVGIALADDLPGRVLAGPIPAQVIQVVDGDTVRVRARIWLDQELVTQVRLAGVDAPELRAHCVAEHDLALAARAFLERLAGDGAVTLTQVTLGKYAGRVVARISNSRAGDWGAALLAAGMARPYDGGARQSWCGGAASAERRREDRRDGFGGESEPELREPLD